MTNVEQTVTGNRDEIQQTQMQQTWRKCQLRYHLRNTQLCMHCFTRSHTCTWTTRWKVAPLRLLLIFQQLVQVFAWSFTSLSNNQIYTLPQSLDEIYTKMTKLCCFNQDNPQFSVFERHVEQTEYEWVHWEDVALKLSRFEPTGLSCLVCHAAKVL